MEDIEFDLVSDYIESHADDFTDTESILREPGFYPPKKDYWPFT
jgi:hypothetical protein